MLIRGRRFDSAKIAAYGFVICMFALMFVLAYGDLVGFDPEFPFYF